MYLFVVSSFLGTVQNKYVVYIPFYIADFQGHFWIQSRRYSLESKLETFPIQQINSQNKLFPLHYKESQRACYKCSVSNNGKQIKTSYI